MGYRRDVDPTASAAALYAHKLRAHRDAKGWTQDALADRVGCTGDLISKLETAKRSATLEMSRRYPTVYSGLGVSSVVGLVPLPSVAIRRQGET